MSRSLYQHQQKLARLERHGSPQVRSRSGQFSRMMPLAETPLPVFIKLARTALESLSVNLRVKRRTGPVIHLIQVYF